MWDIVVRDYSIWNWPRAWYFRILGDKVLAIKESPYNVYAREKKEEVVVGDLTLETWSNQYADIWDLQKLISFLRSCTEPEIEVEAAEWLEPSNPEISEVLREIGAWFTSYPIYD